MSRLAEKFQQLRENGRTALIPYITAGDPDAGATVAFMHTLVEAGADIIELGVPFTDPMADGPVIQAACERALAGGTRLRHVLEMVARFRQTDAQTPVVLMGYFNPIDALGLADFAEKAGQSGVDGVLIVDITPEEAPDVIPTLQQGGLDTIALVAPTTDEDRIAHICDNVSGFIYYVAFKGVTGAASLDTTVLTDQIAPIRRASALPVGVGFGVRTPEDAAAVARAADAVIVGSALVSHIADYAADLQPVQQKLHETLAAMRTAIDASDAGLQEQEDESA